MRSEWHQENHTRVAPPDAGADGRDLPRRGQMGALTAEERVNAMNPWFALYAVTMLLPATVLAVFVLLGCGAETAMEWIAKHEPARTRGGQR